ncbi:MAG: hypothetical protein HC896_08085 [Bacteroidales bacterium]|nr:hypothetical protein [Bacteroidales bacterium]
MPGLPLAALRKSSKARTDTSTRFGQIKHADSLISSFLHKYERLHFTLPKIIAYLTDYKKIVDYIEHGEQQKIESFKVKTMLSETTKMQGCANCLSLQNRLKESILADPYIEETYFIVNEINQTQ